MATAIRPGGARGEVTDRYGSPPGATAAADKYKYKYLIAIAVSLAAMLELIDTSIVNVAIPHMMGNLGATLDEISWVSTGYIIANAIPPLPSGVDAEYARDFSARICLYSNDLGAPLEFHAESAVRAHRILSLVGRTR
jgi:hypothetical protein